MSKYKFFSKDSSMFVFALVLGVALAVGATTWATSIGTNVSVSGTLTNTGAATFSSTITATGGLTTLSYASTTAATFSGTASTTNLVISGLAINQIPYFTTAGLVAGDADLVFDGISKLTATYASTTAFTTSESATFNGSNTFGDAAADVNLFTGTLHASSTALITGTTTHYAALTVGSISENPPAASSLAGMIYYNSTDGMVKLYNGSSWGVIGTSTGLSLSGSSIRLSDLTNGFLTLGTTTPRGASLTTLEATSTLAIPLTLVGRELQTANLFQVANSSGTNLFTLSAAGNPTSTQLTTTGTTYLATAGGNVGVGTTTPSRLFSVHGSGYISSDLYVGGTLTSTSSAASTFPYASTTAVTSSGTASTTNLVVSGLAINRIPFTTTAGLISQDSDLTFDGTSVLTATYASTTAVTVSGTASTSALVVGGAQSFAGLVAGECTTAGTATINATSSAYVVCTPETSGLIRATTDRVLVMATSSLPSNFYIQAASTTAANTISMQIVNKGPVLTTGGTLWDSGTTIIPTAFNFWAFR